MCQHAFIEQMEENTKFSLNYTYHIDKTKLREQSPYIAPENGEGHAHSFEEVLQIVHMEPLAFYLTEEDNHCYSEQERQFINKVKETEVEKINKGYVPIDLELTPETIYLLEEYKKLYNLTTEEAIIQILKMAIKELNKE